MPKGRKNTCNAQALRPFGTYPHDMTLIFQQSISNALIGFKGNLIRVKLCKIYHRRLKNSHYYKDNFSLEVSLNTAAFVDILIHTSIKLA